MKADMLGILLDAAPPIRDSAGRGGNTTVDGFVILLAVLIVILIISFVFCVKQVKNAKKNKKPQSYEQPKNRDDHV